MASQQLTEAIQLVRQINELRKEGIITPGHPFYNLALLIEAAEIEAEAAVIDVIKDDIKTFFSENWKTIILLILASIIIYKSV